MVTEHEELTSLLSRVRRRWFALTALETGARAAIAAAVPLCLGALVAWLFAPPGRWLVLVVSIATLAAAAAVAFVLVRMRRRPDDCDVARFIEERTDAQGLAPVLCDALVSAVSVIEAPDRFHGGFGALLVERAVKVLRDLPPSSVISTEQVRRAGLRAAGGVVVAVAACAILLPYARRAGGTTWLALFPQRIQISVLTRDTRVAAGQPLRIAATVQGRGARFLAIAPSLVVSAGDQQRTVPMRDGPGRFIYDFESVDRSFDYRVAAGTPR
jgi:hypothetical protein